MTKIMVVDDSLFIRNHLEKLLGEHGYETVSAEDGEQAIHLYSTARPDLVLMDITMPKTNGLVALHMIRSSDHEAKVIMLTAMDEQVMAKYAVRLGAKDFLMKPVMPDTLLATLEKALKQSC